MSISPQAVAHRQSRRTPIVPVLALVLSAVCVFATQPVQFNYQARLTDPGGAPLQGAHTLYVTIWSPGGVNTPNGGVQRYGETAAVTTVDGIVNHVVGTGDSSLFGVPLDDAILNRDSEIVLQIAVDSAENIILPRSRLESVPFAVTARSADSSANGVPVGYRILGPSAIAPAGYTATGSVLYGTWVARAPLPVGTSNPAAASSGGQVYMVGGIQGGISSSNLYQFDPLTNLWTTKTPMFTQRRVLSFTELNGLLFAVGGYTPNGGEGALAQNEVYDPATDTWGTSQPLGIERASHAAAAALGKLYVFGGSDDADTRLSSVEEFDPVANSWTPKAPMSLIRSACAAATVNDMIYVIGGTTTGDALSDNDQYDPLQDTWTPKAPLPIKNYGLSAVSFDGKIYVTGGVISGNTYIYDPGSDTWTLGPPMAANRFFLSACLANGRMYAIGGVEGAVTYSDRVEELPAGIHYIHLKN